MRELIKTKFIEYRVNFPQDQEFKACLLRSNLGGWLYSMFLVQDQKVLKDHIADLLDGKLIDDVPLSCYGFVASYKEIVADMQEEILMQTDPSLKLFKRWAGMMGLSEYRQSNPVVYELGFIPCHFRTIDEELEIAFKKFGAEKENRLNASFILCLDIIKVYPYDEETIDMALLVLMYCLLLLGYPVPELYIGQEEFNKLITPYLSDGKDPTEFITMIERSLYNRLDALVMFEEQILGKE